MKIYGLLTMIIIGLLAWLLYFFYIDDFYLLLGGIFMLSFICFLIPVIVINNNRINIFYLNPFKKRYSFSFANITHLKILEGRKESLVSITTDTSTKNITTWMGRFEVRMMQRALMHKGIAVEMGEMTYTGTN